MTRSILSQQSSKATPQLTPLVEFYVAWRWWHSSEFNVIKWKPFPLLVCVFTWPCDEAHWCGHACFFSQAGETDILCAFCRKHPVIYSWHQWKQYGSAVWCKNKTLLFLQTRMHWSVKQQSFCQSKFWFHTMKVALTLFTVTCFFFLGLFYFFLSWKLANLLVN